MKQKKNNWFFSIIYTVDIPRAESIRSYVPPQRHLWQMTEGDEQYDFDYLGESWTKGKHRKWCALLNREQFERFLDSTGLYPENVETMGSLGAPGFGIGWAPAMSFNNYDSCALQGAYVTPIPMPDRDWERTDRDWQRVRKAILSYYGD